MSQTELGARRRTLGSRIVPDHVRPRVTALYRPLLYRGNDVECPCCRRSFGSFMTHRGQPDQRCPGCGAMPRHRLLWLWLHEAGIPELGGLSLLHVAPEWPLRRLLRGLPAVDYHGADLNSKLATEHFDIGAVPHADGAFDLILCSHVLEHVPDDRSAMRELRRVLAPGGTALLMVPVARGRPRTLEDPAITDPGERLRVFGQEDHLRLYGADFPRRLTEAGFAVRTDAMLERLPTDTVVRQRLRPGNPRWADDVIFIGQARR